MNKSKFQNLKFRDWLIVIVLILIPIILFILPKEQFDHGQTICLYTLITGENCIGCGMTRACMRLIHFDILGALNFNKLSVVVFPILVFLYLKNLYSILFKNK